jgi:hypothetical protein
MIAGNIFLPNTKKENVEDRRKRLTEIHKPSQSITYKRARTNPHQRSISDIL